MGRKRIAIVVSTLAVGGFERVAANLSKRFSEIYDVYLIVFDADRIDYEYGGRLIDIGVSLQNRNIFVRFFNAIRVVHRLRRIKKEFSIELAISFGEISNIPNILSGGNVILSIRESRFNAKNDIQRRVVNLIARTLYKKKGVKEIVTVSKGLKEDIEKFWKLQPSKVMVVYNPILVGYIRMKANEDLGNYVELFRKNRVIVNVGRLTFPKGQWYLLRIFKEIRRVLDGYKLVILGEGELQGKLISLSRGLGLRTYNVWEKNEFSTEYDVYFLGFWSNPYKFIRNAYVFVLTSLWEGFPNVVLEALACGQAIVSTNCRTGPVEILLPNSESMRDSKVIYGRYGVLLPSFDKVYLEGEPLTENERCWVSFLVDFLQRPDVVEKYRAKAYQRAMDFDISEIIDCWRKLIEK